MNALDHPTFVSAFRLASAFFFLQGASADIETRRNLQSKDGIGGAHGFSDEVKGQTT